MKRDVIINKLMQIAIKNGEDQEEAFEKSCSWIDRMELLKKIGVIESYGVYNDGSKYKIPKN